MNSRKFKTIFLWHLSIKSKFLLLPISTQFIFRVTCRIWEKVHCFFWSSVIFRKWRSQLGMVSHARNLSIQETEAGGLLCVKSRPAWATQFDPPPYLKEKRKVGRKERKENRDSFSTSRVRERHPCPCLAVYGSGCLSWPGGQKCAFPSEAPWSCAGSQGCSQLCVSRFIKPRLECLHADSLSAGRCYRAD